MTNEIGGGDVIIADNDQIVRGILRTMLEAEGFTVLQAIDGREAIGFAACTQARFVILDYRMPRLDGLAACAEIRQLPGYADVPIVILTAFHDDEARSAAQRAGASMFFTKPFRPIDLLRALGVRQPPTPSRFSEPVAFIWSRRKEPAPLFGEPKRLAEGRRVLNICRR